MIEQSQFAELKEVKPMQFAIDHNEEGIEPGPESDDGIKDDQSAATIEKTDETSEQTQTVLDIKTFKCEYCDQKFDREALSVAVFLYGIFFLSDSNSEDCYIGFSCPKCLKTLLVKMERQAFLIFNQYISSSFFILNHLLKASFPPNLGETSVPIKLRYHSTGQFLLSFRSHDISRYNLDIHSLLIQITDSGWEHVQSEILSSRIDGYLSSYGCCLNTPLGPTVTIVFIKREQVEKAIEIENKENRWIIPRFIHHCPGYNVIDRFCWDHAFFLRYYEKLRDYRAKAIEAIKQSQAYLETEKESEKRQELIGNREVFYKFTSDICANLNGKSQELEAISPFRFFEVLTARETSWDLPEIDHNACRQVWGTLHPFKDKGIPDNFYGRAYDQKDGLSGDLADNPVIEEMAELFQKGYGKQYLEDNHLAFIDEYFELVSTACWSYAALKEIVGRYRLGALSNMKREYAEDQRYLFKSVKDSWVIKFEGKLLGLMRGNGFKYIQFLLENKRESFTTDELQAHFPDKQTDQNDHSDQEDLFSPDDEREKQNKEIRFQMSGSESKQAVVDEKAEKDLNKEYQRLTQELSEAKLSNNPLLIKEAQNAYNKFLVPFNEMFELKGKKGEKKKRVLKKFRNNNDRIKDKIAKSIDRALQSVKKHDEEAYQHLYSALEPIYDFNQCYDPKEDIDWYFG